MSRYSVGGEAHKQDWSVEVKATVLEVIALLGVLTVIAIIFVLAITGGI